MMIAPNIPLPMWWSAGAAAVIHPDAGVLGRTGRRATRREDRAHLVVPCDLRSVEVDRGLMRPSFTSVTVKMSPILPQDRAGKIVETPPSPASPWGDLHHDLVGDQRDLVPVSPGAGCSVAPRLLPGPGAAEVDLGEVVLGGCCAEVRCRDRSPAGSAGVPLVAEGTTTMSIHPGLAADHGAPRPADSVNGPNVTVSLSPGLSTRPGAAELEVVGHHANVADVEHQRRTFRYLDRRR